MKPSIVMNVPRRVAHRHSCLPAGFWWVGLWAGSLGSPLLLARHAYAHTDAAQEVTPGGKPDQPHAALLLSQTRLSLSVLGLVNQADAKNIRLERHEKVAIPTQKDVHGYRVTIDGKTLAYVKAAAGGTLSIVYDAQGTSRGNPARLISQTRNGVMALGLAREAQFNQVTIDLSREVQIPRAYGEQKPGQDMRGHLVSVGNKPIAYVKAASGGYLAAIYDLKGTPWGHPGRMLYMTRASLLMKGMIRLEDLERVHIGFSKDVSIPNREVARSYPVELNGETLAFVTATSTGHFSSTYDEHGKSLGNPLRLLWETRSSLVELGAVAPDEVEDVRIDFSKKVAIPGHRQKADAWGYIVTLPDDSFFYLNATEAGYLSTIYDRRGTALGKPGQLRSQAGRGLMAAGVLRPADSSRVRIDSAGEVAIPNQQGAQGYRVSLDDETVGYVKTTTGRKLSVLYDAAGTPLGNPSQLITQVRRSLVLLGMATNAEVENLHIDLSKEIVIPKQKGERGYSVAHDETPSTSIAPIAYVKVASGGNLAQLYDQHGTAKGNPLQLASQARSGLLLLGLASAAELDKVRIDFDEKVPIPGQERATGYPILLGGALIAYATPTLGGYLSTIYDRGGAACGNPANLLAQTRSNLEILGLLKDDESERIRIDLTQEIVIPGAASRQEDERGYAVTLQGQPLAYIRTTAAGMVSALYDLQGTLLGNPALLLSETRRSLIALGRISEREGEDVRIQLDRPTPIPGTATDGKQRALAMHGYPVTLQGVTVAYLKTGKGGRLSMLHGPQGKALGNPAQLTYQTRSSVVALGLADATESGNIHIDLAETVFIPGQPQNEQASGHAVSLGEKVIAYIKTTPGGMMHGIFDEHGKGRGNPGSLKAGARRGLELMGVLPPGENVAIDFTEAAPYPVIFQGQRIAFARPTPNGTLSALYSGRDGNVWGNPAMLCKQLRSCIRQLDEMAPPEIPLLKVDFASLAAGATAPELPVNDAQGRTRYFVIPHPRSGYLLQLLDSNKQLLFERKGKRGFVRAARHQ